MRVAYTYKFKLFLLFMVAYAIFYLYPNFFASTYAVRLPLQPIDLAVPFIPWTFMIYTSDYFLFLIVILMQNDLERFHSMSRMFFAVLFIAGTVFILYPTEYPRPEYPVVSNPIIHFWMELVRNGDTPRNCLPSMHVAMTAVATWSIRYRGRFVFWFFFVWSLAIFASTMTTKQHYFVDILGGLAVALGVAILETILVRGYLAKRKPEPFFTKDIRF